MTIRAEEIIGKLSEDRQSVHVLSNGDGRPVTYNSMRIALRRLCKKLKIPSRGWYGFRHAFGLRMAENGMPVHRLKVLMGHASLTTTEIYLQAQAEEFKDDVRRIAAITQIRF